jgi:hypothetical protein
MIDFALENGFKDGETIVVKETKVTQGTQTADVQLKNLKAK